VVAVDVQVASGLDAEVDQSVTRDLIEHVVKKTDARGQLRLASAVEIDPDLDLCFFGVATDLGNALCHRLVSWSGPDLKPALLEVPREIGRFLKTCPP